VIPVDGVFCLKDSYRPVTLLKGLEMEGTHIKVDRRQETSSRGCYLVKNFTHTKFENVRIFY
jgi:thioredoxin reductase (NADPH)